MKADLHRAGTLFTLALLLAGAAWGESRLPMARGFCDNQAAVQVVEEDEVRTLPTFLFNQRAHMAGRVNDLFGFAQSLALTGVTEDNAFIFAQNIDLSGAVLGDLYAFCQTLRITGDIGGDLYLGAGELELAPGAVVRGSIYVGAGTVDLDGRVEGGIHGEVGSVRLNGELLGAADLDLGRLVIGPQARLLGDVNYTAASPAEVDSNAVIAGDLSYHEEIVVADDADDGKKAKGAFSLFGLLQWVGSYLGALILGVVLLAVLGRHARQPSALLDRKPGLALGVGFLIFVVTPVAALIAIILILPMPLGLTALLLYIAALFMAGLVVSLWLGGRLLGWMGRPGEPGYLALILGLLAIWLLGSIPYLGFLVQGVALVAGLGGIFLALRGRNGAQAPTRA